MEKTFNYQSDANFYDKKDFIIAVLKRKINSFKEYDAPKWVKEELLNVGKTCYVDGHINKEYVFKGIQETFEDYYYILEDNNKKISYSSCVGKISYK